VVSRINTSDSEPACITELEGFHPAAHLECNGHKSDGQLAGDFFEAAQLERKKAGHA